MNCHSRRFNESAEFGSEIVRDLDECGFRKNEKFLCHSRRLESYHLKMIADVITSFPAEGTYAADYLRGRGNQIADPDGGNATANLRHFSAELVALHYRVGSIGVFTVKDVNIGTANSDSFDAQERFPIFHYRLRYVFEFDPSRLGHGRSKHIWSPSVSRMNHDFEIIAISRLGQGQRILVEFETVDYKALLVH
jgi:hypothetical protein